MARTRGMSKTAYLERLAEVPLFRSLSKRDLQRLARHSNRVSVGAGEGVIREGETGYEFFVIASGTATVRRKRRKVATLDRGDFFGELALLGNIPRNASVTADTDLELQVLDRREFSAVLREVPEIAVKLLKGLAQRVSEADRKTIH